MLLALLSQPQPAPACGWGDPENLESVTTFDPRVAGEPAEGIYYNPYARFEACDECVRRQNLGEWSAHLGSEIKTEEWARVLYKASLPDIDRLIFHLQGKETWADAAKSGWPSVLAASGATKAKLIPALFFVGFARRVEPFAVSGSSPEWVDEKPAPPPDPAAAADLQKNGEAALKRASDPFLKQRYALQLVRLRFYRRDHAGVVKTVKDGAAALDAPSPSVRAMARRYLAGSLAHENKGGEALLELARVFASAPALSSAIATDLVWAKPEDWKSAKALATKPADAVALRAMLALSDGLAGLAEVAKLDPTSTLIPLLAVREIERAEVDRSDLGPLEKLALAVAAAPGADRPWVLWLVAAHAAAMRGDVSATRDRIARAQKARPGDTRVEQQAKASLALALANAPKTTPASEDEVVATLSGIEGKTFTRRPIVEGKVRTALSGAFRKSGRMAESELLTPSIPFALHQLGASYRPWTDAALVKDLLARVSSPKTAFQKYAVEKSGYTAAHLERELALMHVRLGDYAAAAKAFPARHSKPLDADPFVFRIRDCHDCGEGSVKWTHASLIQRLGELKSESAGTGEPAAKASFELAVALYNLSTWGSASHFYAGSHSGTSDLADAEKLFARARSLSKDRELQAKAAFGEAKCELARAITVEIERENPYGPLDPLPVPEKSFPVLKSYADTKYHREILAECGHYAAWQ